MGGFMYILILILNTLEIRLYITITLYEYLVFRIIGSWIF
uniref:Uncharacterized protein n=1 Tax=Heterorhabditis bacteriophora TaxID=37862 RepID=A0A1I7X7R1_HETBA